MTTPRRFAKASLCAGLFGGVEMSEEAMKPNEARHQIFETLISINCRDGTASAFSIHKRSNSRAERSARDAVGEPSWWDEIR